MIAHALLLFMYLIISLPPPEACESKKMGPIFTPETKKKKSRTLFFFFFTGRGGMGERYRADLILGEEIKGRFVRIHPRPTLKEMASLSPLVYWAIGK